MKDHIAKFTRDRGPERKGLFRHLGLQVHNLLVSKAREMISDAGRTEFAEGTVTALSISRAKDIPYSV